MEENRVSFSKDEVARRLGVSRDSVARAMRRGEIKFIRFGRRVLIPSREIERLFEGSEMRGLDDREGFLPPKPPRAQ
jgi:excisionase family DNA binding protein